MANKATRLPAEVTGAIIKAVPVTVCQTLRVVTSLAGSLTNGKELDLIRLGEHIKLLEKKMGNPKEIGKYTIERNDIIINDYKDKKDISPEEHKGLIHLLEQNFAAEKTIDPKNTNDFDTYVREKYGDEFSDRMNLTIGDDSFGKEFDAYMAEEEAKDSEVSENFSDTSANSSGLDSYESLDESTSSYEDLLHTLGDNRGSEAIREERQKIKAEETSSKELAGNAEPDPTKKTIEPDMGENESTEMHP